MTALRKALALRQRASVLKSDQSGLTLIEIVITSAVIGIIAALAIPTFIITINMVKESQTTTSATYQVKRYIEKAQQASQSSVGADGDGYPGNCENAMEATNVTLLPASFSAGSDSSTYTLRRYIIQGCTREESILRDQTVIARIEARKGTATNGKVLANIYYSVFVPGTYAESQ